MLKQIVNGRILTPQGWLVGGSVVIDGNKIKVVSNIDLHVVDAEIIDAKGCYVVPGGIDMHAHGGGGHDFMEGTEEAFRAAVNAHLKHGTTSIYPTRNMSLCSTTIRASSVGTKHPSCPVRWSLSPHAAIMMSSPPCRARMPRMRQWPRPTRPA